MDGGSLQSYGPDFVTFLFGIFSRVLASARHKLYLRLSTILRNLKKRGTSGRSTPTVVVVVELWLCIILHVLIIQRKVVSQ